MHCHYAQNKNKTKTNKQKQKTGQNSRYTNNSTKSDSVKLAVKL
jgi:hypothetical protein